MTSPDGLYDWLTLAAVATALCALAVATWAVVALRRTRRAQKVVLGSDNRDIVAHAESLQREFVALRDWIDESAAAVDRRIAHAESRLDGSIAHTAMIRYDAYGEMTGHQSSSVVFADDKGNGVVISAIRHRNHSHLYVKQLRDGHSDIELSPEEREALNRAFADKPVVAPPEAVPPQPPRTAEKRAAVGDVHVHKSPAGRPRRA